MIDDELKAAVCPCIHDFKMPDEYIEKHPCKTCSIEWLKKRCENYREEREAARDAVDVERARADRLFAELETLRRRYLEHHDRLMKALELKDVAEARVKELEAARRTVWTRVYSGNRLLSERELAQEGCNLITESEGFSVFVDFDAYDEE